MIDVFMCILTCSVVMVCVLLWCVAIFTVCEIRLINLWRKYPKRKPKKEGWYQCTVKHGFGIDKPRVMDLYFHDGYWTDRRRKQVFEGYKVYKPTRASIEDNRVWGDELCDRDDVIAWRKLPNIYNFGRRY